MTDHLSPCSPRDSRGLTTRCSRTSGAWVSLWWRWQLGDTPSPLLMPRSWSCCLDARWREMQRKRHPGRGPLGGPSAVSDLLFAVRTVGVLLEISEWLLLLFGCQAGSWGAARVLGWVQETITVRRILAVIRCHAEHLAILVRFLILWVSFKIRAC